MKSYVKIGEREVLVELEDLDRDCCRALIDGREIGIDIARANGLGGAMSVLIDGHQVEVFARARANGLGSSEVDLIVNGRSLRALVSDPLSRLAREASADDPGRGTVVAYMPGRVVALLVEEGSEVRRGQGVLVLEAMKMENEIVADADGRLARFHVEVGQAVEGGDDLFEVSMDG